MNKIKFPRRQPDGSFCVEVTLSVMAEEPEELLRRVQEWAIKWVEANQVWIWMGGTKKLLYQQEFKREPHPTSCTSTELKIQFEGQPSAKKMWKDWIVYRILPDLKEAFTEVRDVSSIKNCG